MATLKDLSGKRSGYLGVVTRYVNNIKSIMSKPVEEVDDDLNALTGKLLDSKEKLDGVSKQIVEHDECEEQLKKDVEEARDKATHAVVSVLDDLENWKKYGPVIKTVHGLSTSSKVVVAQDSVQSDGIQEATLGVLLQLQQSMDRISKTSVQDAVRLALSEQSAAHEKEKMVLLGRIDALSEQLKSVQLGAVSSEDLDSADDGSRASTGETFKLDKDYRLTSTTLHSRDSAGPIRSRLTGFGRGRVSAGVYVRDPGGHGPQVRRSDTSRLVGGSRDTTRTHDDSAWLMQSLLEQSMLQHQSLVSNMQAPKVSIKKFSGSPLEYASFMATFEDLIHNVVDSDRSRLMQLLEHCTGEAEKTIQCCAHMSAAEGYSAARRLLKERFGQAHIVTQAWLDKVMSYPELDSDRLLNDFAQDLVCCRNSLESLNSLAEIECTSSLRLIVAKLPVNLRAKWRRQARKTRDQGERRIDQLVKLIREAAEDSSDPTFSEEAIAKVKATYGARSPNSRIRPTGADKKGYVNCNRDDYFAAEVDGVRDIEAEVYAAARSACAACRSGQHFTSRCRSFKELGPKERLEFVKTKKLCLLCLSDMHATDKCPLPWRCQEKTCGQRHHTALHGAFQTGSVNALEQARQEREPVIAQSYCCVSTANLPVIKVKVQWGDSTRFANALLDTGSTVSMIHEELVEELGAPKISTGAYLSIRTLTSEEMFEGRLSRVKISHPADNFKHDLSNAMIVPRVPISSDCIPRAESINRWYHLKALEIPLPVVEDGVQILIGQNNPHLLDFGEKVKAPGMFSPYAVETPLGYCLQGSLEEEAEWEDGQQVLSFAMGGSVLVNKIGDITDEEAMVDVGGAAEQGTDTSELIGGLDLCSLEDVMEALQALEQQVDRLAQLDEVPECDLKTESEKYVLDLWEKHMSFEDGHIVLPIPFKSDPPELLNNFNAAYRSLMQLGRTLLPNPRELKQYADAIGQYFIDGHAEVVDDDNPGDPKKKAWYLLHMGVKHPRKPDVTRVVKRGDAQYKGCSLNKAAHKGPDLMNSLIGVLTRFRQYRVGTTGDLKGMFNQVLVPEHQRDFERFLFWEDGDPTKKVIVCRMKTHVFGSVWAPAAANFAIKKLAEKQKELCPEVAESMQKEFYVDDWMNSAQSDERSMQMLEGVRAAVAEGSFEMGKIASSSREVLSRISLEQRAKELAKVDLTTDKLPRNVMLGQGWEPDPDNLVFSLTMEPKPFTRRGMTSCVSSVFDPLGLLCPFLLPAKILMQQACKGIVGWDEQLRDVTAEQWSEWLLELEQVEKFRLRRWFGCSDLTRQFFHIFADASELSYAAASYLTVMDIKQQLVEEQDVKVPAAVGRSTLVSAKSRVAPSKRLTIPQLEMSGAVLAVKVAQMAMAVFSISVEAVYYWVDSTIVLILLHKDPGELKTFMGNRVTFIQQLTDITQWGHVPSKLNPADIASRGMRLSELAGSELWTGGPDFIRQDHHSWPAKTVKIKACENADKEVKKNSGAVFAAEVHAVCCDGHLMVDSELLNEELECSVTEAQVYPVSKVKLDEKQTLDRIVSRYSDISRTVRLAAILTRIAAFWRAKVRGKGRSGATLPRSSELTAEELDREEINLVVWVQKFEISWEERLTPSWKKLTPTLMDGWRVGGRFLYAELPHDEKHPLILPRHGALTEQVLRRAHLEAGHGGADRTMLELRKRYWILGGRVTVKRITDACILCKRLKASPCEQQMAPLPAERLVRGRPVFWFSGVDLFGPIHVTVKRSQVKRYGALFTCMNTRAIHLEPVEDLTTSAFLDTLERFSDRRGKPDTLQSDNGKNFVGSDREMDRAEAVLTSGEIKKEMADRRIKWRFNSPSASHQGGVWERLIRSVRLLLVVLTDGKGLTDSRFHTVLCMAEAIMNSRPLTRLTEDVDSIDALTPFHFINLQAVRPLFPGKYSATQLRKDWHYSQGLAGEFWDQWMGLYLPQLQRRTKWLEERRNVRENELVLILNDQHPRCEWPLGVITKVHPGKDGLVRNVTVRTANGFYTRPVQKIVRLEMDVT